VNDLAGNVPSTYRVRAEARKNVLAQARADWRQFPELPGTHLSFRRSGRGSYELVTSNDSVWAASTGGHFSRPKSTIRVRGRAYRWQLVGPSLGRVRTTAEAFGTPTGREREVVDATTNLPVLHMTGRHFSLQCGTRVVLSDGSAISLPVRGNRPGNAVMAAIDERGAVLIQYRLLRPKSFRPYQNVEVVVSPEARSVPGIELLVAVTAHCLLTYPAPTGGGG
jgi:hypothetical protein